MPLSGSRHPQNGRTVPNCSTVVKIPSQSRKPHKRKHADLARYPLHPSHDVRCAGGGPCAALLIDPPHSFPVAREPLDQGISSSRPATSSAKAALTVPVVIASAPVAFAQLWPRQHRAAPGSWLIPANHQSISATGIIRLTSLFSQLDRHEEDQTGRNGQTKKKASE